jgi:nitroreductase
MKGAAYVELREAITTRRSVAKIQERPDPRTDCKGLLELSAWAPSGMNTQPWLYVVLEGKA